MDEPKPELSKEQSKQVCRNLANLARSLKLTQEQLAQQTGYQQSNVARLFSGRYSPRLDVIFTLLTAINELSGQHFTLKDIDLPTANNTVNPLNQ